MPDPANWTFVEGGDMKVRIGHDRTTVWIDFGKNVSAFKITPEMALAFAEKIQQQAIEAKIGL